MSTELIKEKLQAVVDSFDIEEATEAMREVLEVVADHIEDNEPYATNTIKRMRDVAFDIACIVEDYDIDVS